jgi:hypothetical protein
VIARSGFIASLFLLKISLFPVFPLFFQAVSNAEKPPLSVLQIWPQRLSEYAGGRAGGGVLQVALMLRQHGLAVLEQAERRLEFAAHRQKLGCGGESGRQFDRARRKAAGAAQHAGFAVGKPHDGIVDPVGDLAVMNESVGGDRGKPPPRLAVVDDRRFLEMLPLVITSGPSMSCSSRKCSGVVGSMKPSVSRPGATAAR